MAMTRNISRAAMMLLLCVLTMTAQTAWADNDAVSYIDMDGKTQTVTTYTEVTSAMTADTWGDISWSTGTYVVKTSTELSGHIKFNGEVIDLILCDGATLTVNGSSNGAFDVSTLNIYAQSTGTSMGVLTANGGTNCGKLNVAGGKVTLNGSSYGLYLFSGSGNGLTVNGGDVTIQNNDTYQGTIYCNGNDNFVTLNGGRLTVTNSNDASGKSAIEGQGNNTINLNGGTAEINGWICKFQNINLNGGNVTINGQIYSSYDCGYTVTYDFTHATDSYYIQEFYNYNNNRTVKVKDGLAFLCNGKSYSGTLSNDEIAAISGQKMTPDVSSDFAVSADGKTYTIKNATGWGYFCDALQDNDTYNRFSGKTVRLGANIAVSRMAGSSTHDFCGTFDGGGNTLTFNYGESGDPTSVEYAAPFSYVSNTKANTSDTNNSPAAIKNLHVTGDIYTSAKYAAGLVAQHWGTLNIENCHSSIVIHSSVTNNAGNDGTHGGFEGASNGALTIIGCVFDGKLLTTATNGTTKCGGFVGYGTCTISNSLYAPAAIADGETEVGVTESATFVRNSSAGTNCYYTRTLGTEQGKQARSITAGQSVTVEVSPVGEPTSSDDYNGVYSVSGITAYTKGITRTVDETTTFYYGNEDEVSLTLSNSAAAAPLGYQYSYNVSGGTLTGTTLTMPDADVTVSLGDLAVIDWATESTGDSEATAYMIYNKDQLDLLATRVNDGTSGYKDKYFKLGADITYDYTVLDETDSNYTPIGGVVKDGNNLYARYFSGHFDGDNHVIKGIRIYKGGNTGGDYKLGLFGYISGTAKVENIILADTRITGYQYVGGIVGDNYSGTVENCHVLSDVTIHAVQTSANEHGGIVGRNYSGSVTGCTSAANITIADGISDCKDYGGIVGYINEGAVSDCLYLGTTIGGTKYAGAIAGYNSGGSVANSYFTDTTISGKGYSGNALANAASAVGVGSSTNCGLVPQDTKDNSGFIALLAARNTALTAVERTPALSTAVDVTLTGRTLYKDGKWNTLCLPFSIADINAKDGNDNYICPLHGATELKELDTDAGTYEHVTGLDNGTLYLNFKDATSIVAGKPYLIKWAAAENLVNPVFTGVTIDKTMCDVVFSGGSFKGTYAYQTFDTENTSILLVGANNNLYWPEIGAKIGAFRAYFDLGTTNAPDMNIVLNFGDTATGIENVQRSTFFATPHSQRENVQCNGAWFTLDGRKLQGQPTTKGIYVNNGRKVVVE